MRRLQVAAAALAVAGGVAAAGTAAAPHASAAAVNDETVSQFVETVNREADRYGLGYVSVTVADLGDDTIIAGTQYGAITLNLSWAVLPPEQFNALVAEDIAVGYEPGGCAGIQAVAVHEVGHVIDQRDGAVARKSVAIAASYGQVGYDLHGYAFDEYGAINPGEAVAVSFQAVECGSATPTEVSIYNVLVS